VAIPRINDPFGFLRLIRGLATPSVGKKPTISRHHRKIAFLE